MLFDTQSHNGGYNALKEGAWNEFGFAEGLSTGFGKELVQRSINSSTSPCLWVLLIKSSLGHRSRSTLLHLSLSVNLSQTTAFRCLDCKSTLHEPPAVLRSNLFVAHLWIA